MSKFYQLFLKSEITSMNMFQGWLELEEAVQLGPVRGFGESVSSIIDAYLSQ